MNNNDIMKVINETNTNRTITWSILENSDTKIVLTTSYDRCVSYTIAIKQDGDGEEWIMIRNDHMHATVDLLWKGDARWYDYQDTKQGITMAIKRAVNNFNYTY